MGGTGGNRGGGICGGSWLKVSGWSWNGGGPRSSGRVCCGIEVVFDVTGKVEG